MTSSTQSLAVAQASVNIAIIVAMPAEKKALPQKFQHCAYVAGIGLKNAHKCAQARIAQGASHIIVAGVAGGLAAELKIGDLVVATEITCRDTGRSINTSYLRLAEPINSQRARPIVNIIQGAILTSTTSVRAHEKPPLAHQHHTLAVDMESFPIAELCQQNGCEFFAIRSISDDHKSDIPSAISTLIDRHQSVPPLKLMIAIARSPSLIPKLVRMAKDYQRALRSLKHCEALFNQIIQAQDAAQAHPLSARNEP